MATELDYPFIEALEREIERHGEAHAVINEHDAGAGGDEFEIRQGTTTFDYGLGLLVIEGANTTHYLDMDSVVRFYLPREPTH